MSQGADSTTEAVTAAETHQKQRVSFRNKAVRSLPRAAVSMGTKAKTRLLSSTEFSVSIGPMATARASARLCVPSR
jgi:hypothetical protein